MCVMRGLTKRKHSHPRNSGRSRLDIVDDKNVMDHDVLTETILSGTSDFVLAAFISPKSETGAMFDRLAALSADHFECSPRDRNWGHVGTLGNYRARFHEITDMAFGKVAQAETA